MSQLSHGTAVELLYHQTSQYLSLFLIFLTFIFTLILHICSLLSFCFGIFYFSSFLSSYSSLLFLFFHIFIFCLFFFSSFCLSFLIFVIFYSSFCFLSFVRAQIFCNLIYYQFYICIYSPFYNNHGKLFFSVEIVLTTVPFLAFIICIYIYIYFSRQLF